MREIGRHGALRIVEMTDEREPLSEAALQVIVQSIPARDLHPVSMLRGLLEKTRTGASAPDDYHLIALLDERDVPIAAASGRYLSDTNAGFVMYLAVVQGHRGQGLGTIARDALVEVLRGEAQRNGHANLAAVMGEITFDKPWLLALVRAGTVVPLDLEYYHPGMAPGWSQERYVLYRQPLEDSRRVFSADEVRAMLDSVWMRGYRFRDPRPHPGYRAMLEQLESRETVGAQEEVVALARNSGRVTKGA